MKSFSRRDFLQYSTVAGLGSLAACTPETAQPGSAPLRIPNRPPHIVLVVLDTLRADKLSCYGYGQETSPALDALAAGGARFNRVVSQCSWTRPSMGSMLTSLHPRTLGLYKEKGEILNDRFETLAMLLKGDGYRTFGFTANPNINSIYNFHQGYDGYVDSDVVFGWMATKPGMKKRGPVNLPSANELFQEALDRTDGHGDTPNFVMVNAMEVHEWYLRNTMIRPEYQQMFQDAGEKYPKYLQSARQLTDDTAAFAQAFSARPGFENTIFAIVADHGEGLDEHGPIEGSKYHGWLLYESQVVVPWVLYSPAWRPAQPVIDMPVRMLELMPTLLDFAGVEAPSGIAGKSLKPVLDGAADHVDLPEYFVAETFWRSADKIAAYANDWKYFHNRSGQAGLPRHELQPRGAGEQGQRNSQHAAHPEIVAPMQQFLKQWESEHPKTPATPQTQELPEDMKRQLEAIGYLGNEPGETE